MSEHDAYELAYKRMAHGAHYRPAAPSDGFGHITAPESELDLNREAIRYSRNLEGDPLDLATAVGVPDSRDRQAYVFGVEAVRMMCGCAPEVAVKLLRMAMSDLERTHGLYPKELEWRVDEADEERLHLSAVGNVLGDRERNYLVYGEGRSWDAMEMADSSGCMLVDDVSISAAMHACQADYEARQKQFAAKRNRISA